MLAINDEVKIDGRYIRVSYVRSSGPGGQNVNKVNTQAQLRFDLAACDDLTATVKRRLATLAGRRLTNDGTLIINSGRNRDQLQNRRDCFERLTTLIRQALIQPKHRRPTKPTTSSRRKRLADKAHRRRIKTMRRTVRDDE